MQAARRYLLLPAYAVAVAALLTFCDWFCHVRQGVLYYTHPEHGALLPGQPTLDVFRGFMSVAVFCTVVGWALFRRSPPAGARKALASGVLFVACYFLSGVFVASPMALYVGFMSAWALYLATFERDLKALVGFSVLLGALGPMLEGFQAERGFFGYFVTHAYHVPVWLSALYFVGALAVATSVSALEGFRKGTPSVSTPCAPLPAARDQDRR